MTTSKENLGTIKKEKASEILRKMYIDPKAADVNFTFSLDGNQISAWIPAHKCILAQNSEVFYKMFFGELRECGDVSIADVTAEAFKEFLQFFYLNEFKLSKEYVPEVLYLSHKYDLEEGSLTSTIDFHSKHHLPYGRHSHPQYHLHIDSLNIEKEKGIVLLKHGVDILFNSGGASGTCNLVSELIFQYC